MLRVLVCSLHFQHLLLHRNPESLPFQCRLSQVVLEYWPLNGDDDDDDDDDDKKSVLCCHKSKKGHQYHLHH